MSGSGADLWTVPKGEGKKKQDCDTGRGRRRMKMRVSVYQQNKQTLASLRWQNSCVILGRGGVKLHKT